MVDCARRGRARRRDARSSLTSEYERGGRRKYFSRREARENAYVFAQFEATAVCVSSAEWAEREIRFADREPGFCNAARDLCLCKTRGNLSAFECIRVVTRRKPKTLCIFRFSFFVFR